MYKLTAVICVIVFTLSCAASPKYRTSSISTPVRPAEVSVKDSEDYKDWANARSLQTFMGVASWYGQKFHGRKTANGEIYDMYKNSAAHKEFPFNTIVRVTNLKNNKFIITRINDRGPFIQGRDIDLSYAAAKELDMIIDGVVKVKIEVLKWGPLELEVAF